MGFLPPISTFMAGMRGEQATSLASWPHRQAGVSLIWYYSWWIAPRSVEANGAATWTETLVFPGCCAFRRSELVAARLRGYRGNRGRLTGHYSPVENRSRRRRANARHCARFGRVRSRPWRLGATRRRSQPL